MGGFIVPVIEVVVAILDIYWWLVVIQAVVSWLIAFNIINTYSRPVAMVLDFLYRVTEPALRPIRQFIPAIGGLDVLADHPAAGHLVRDHGVAAARIHLADALAIAPMRRV